MIEQCTVGATGFFNTCGQFVNCIPSSVIDLDKTGTCVHDSPYTAKAGLIIAYVITPILVGVGTLCGLGGGVLKGPFLEMILNYSEIEATQIAYCFMVGGSFLNTVMLMFEKNPSDKARPIINYRVAIIFNLAVPLATNLGSSLTIFMPQLYTLILQELFLFAIAPVMWKRAMQAKANELKETPQAKDKGQKQENEDPTIELNKVQQLSKLIPTSSQHLLEESSENANNKEQLYDQFKKESEKVLPIKPILIIISSFGLNQIIIQMRSNSISKPSYVGIEDCTWENGFILAILVLVNLIFGYFVYLDGVKDEGQFNQVNFLPKERYFTPISKFLLMYAGGFAAGFVAGFLGMGAGLVMIPVLLQYELLPRIASATSAFINLMISLNNLISLLTIDHLGWEILVLYIGLSIIGGSVITKIGYYLLDRYKIGYYVVMFVFAMIIANIISQIYYGVVTGERFGMVFLTTANKEFLNWLFQSESSEYKMNRQLSTLNFDSDKPTDKG